MRPTVEEQLLGTCRILEKVVSPCVADPYARTMLEGLIANLRMLTGAQGETTFSRIRQVPSNCSSTVGLIR